MTRGLSTALALMLSGAPAHAAPPAHAPRPDSARLEVAAAPDSIARDSLAPGALHADSAALALLQTPAPAPPETLTPARASSAPVFLGHHEVFRVLVPRDGLDPAERAAAIRARLDLAVADGRVPADSVQLMSRPDGIQVNLGPHFLWLITPGDAPSQDPTELATRLATLPAAIRDGVERERNLRRPARVLISGAIAVVLTLIALAVFRLLLLASRRWRAWLDRTLGRRLPAIRLRNFEVLSRRQIAGTVTAVLARLDVGLGLMLLYAYLTAVFSLFPWTQGWSALLLSFAAGQVLKILRGMGAALPGLFAIAVIFVIFRWLSGIAGRFFDAIADGSLTLGNFHPELAKPSKKLFGILLWVIAAMVAYPYIPGSGSRAVQGVSLVFGLMLSLGSTGFVGNMISGVVLTYSRAFRAGDRVKIGEQIGDVIQLGFFATKLRTVRNEEVTIPNGQVTSTSIVNYTRLAADPGLILHTAVTLGYDLEWRKVHALLIEAAGRVEGVEKEPAPWVYQRSLDDSYVTYELNCVTRQSHPQLRLYSDLHAQIQDAFNRAGIEILSPAYHAIRDANAAVLAPEPGGPRPAPGGFRVRPS